MLRLASPLLCALLALVPAAPALAGPQGAAPALLGLAGQSGQTTAQLRARLKEEHARTDAALKLRRERFDAWQSLVEARDAAAAKVERLKGAGQRGPELEAALRSALVLDEKTSLARSQLMAAEAEVARRGAALLRVYDAVLVLQRREADGLKARDPRRERALAAWQALSQQRDKVRRSLGPVLGKGASFDAGDDVGIEARPDDDVETLLEKADLARDLEERFLRRAQAVERRIQELVEERQVARDVAGLVKSQSLFDEDDMRLRVISTDVRADPSLPSALPGSNGARDSVTAVSGGAEAGGSRSRPDADQQSPAPAPPSFAGGGDVEAADDGTSGGAPMEPALGVDAVDADSAGDRGAGGGLLPDVGGAALPRAAERAFAPTSADVDVAALLASGELSLPELLALQKKLKERAAQMKAQSRALKEKVKERDER